MKSKVITGIMLTLLLVGMLTLAFNIRPVKSGIASDTTPPVISIFSPLNITYYIPLVPWNGAVILTIYPPPPPLTFIPLNFAVDETTSWIGYSLNGQANVTITGNTTLVLLPGEYYVAVYANDTAGNMGFSETVYFKVRVLGDMNIDGKITIIDIVIVALHFGEDHWHPNWNPLADLTQDGRITITDIVIVAMFFGRTWV